MNYQDYYQLTDEHYTQYLHVLDLASKETTARWTVAQKSKAIAAWHNLFPAFRPVDRSIDLTHYHVYYDNACDLMMHNVLAPREYCTFASYNGQYRLQQIYRYEYLIYKMQGCDMSDPLTLKHYRLDCDYIYIVHNRTYTYRNLSGYHPLSYDVIHMYVDNILSKMSEIHDAATLIAACGIKDTLVLKRKFKILYKDRKRQLTCCKSEYRHYVHNFDDYLKVLYDPATRLSKSIIKAEKKSYIYYNHKYQNVIHPKLALDSSKSTAQQVKDMITVKKSDKDYYNQYRNIYSKLSYQSKKSSKKIDTI